MLEKVAGELNFKACVVPVYKGKGENNYLLILFMLFMHCDFAVEKFFRNVENLCSDGPTYVHFVEILVFGLRVKSHMETPHFDGLRRF